MPLFFMNFEREFNWNQIFLEWIRLLPFLFIFLINNSLLVPTFLFENKRMYYILGLLVSISFVIYLSDFTRILHELLFVPNKIPDFIPPPNKIVPHRLPSEHFNDIPRKPFSKMIIDNIFVSFLIIAFNNAIKYSFLWQKQKHIIEAKEKEQLKNELSFLRQQISPHFFMNTLNNIHALIDFDTEKAKIAVIDLSKLMRHLLKESENEYISINDEMIFINSYIDLMKLRFSEKVKINLVLPDNIPEKKIPTLLFISLLENAFKYGISYKKESFINISINFADNKLYFSIENSKIEEISEKKGLGIGIKNTEKRLKLLFENNFTFKIFEDQNIFSVNLIIPIND